jgi:2-oxoglutarate dehydrogenase E2 component (dihydrolipoamide succinyltransferase)
MPVEVKVPAAGESVTEAIVAEWLKAEGDTVRQDEPLVTLETDKAALDLPAPVAGVLVRIVKPRGATVRVGEVIAVLDEAGVPPPGRKGGGDSRGEAGPAKAGGDGPARGRTPRTAPRAPETPIDPGRSARAGGEPAAAGPSASPSGEAREARVMPAARALMDEHGIEASAVTPTGPGGRLLKQDVLAHLDEARGGPAAAATRARQEELVPMSLLRRRIAERLVQAQQTAALLTTFNEIDMTAVTALRRAHQEAFQARYQIKLGFMSFFVKAVIAGLELVPGLNAEVRGTDIAYRSYHDIGIAVGGGRGLVVPVLRDANVLGFAGIERAIADFARRAQANQLTPDDLAGGTFTISNGGIYGSLLSTPIVNPPQSGILGLHAIQDRPVARDGQVVVRPMMYVALTYDHRIVDGREAVTFLRHVKAVVEDPARLLLEV